MANAEYTQPVKGITGTGTGVFSQTVLPVLIISKRSKQSQPCREHVLYVYCRESVVLFSHHLIRFPKQEKAIPNRERVGQQLVSY